MKQSVMRFNLVIEVLPIYFRCFRPRMHELHVPPEFAITVVLQEQKTL